ncbi:MAG: GNAT family N-acetyltransferase [Patescibacteria group bacterium]|nr:GNAT family N-acetyltransferase [Patescibacteria group bacterium]
MSFQIKEYNQFNSHLISDWQKLWDKSPCAHFFNSPKWFLSCLQAFPSKGYRVVAVYDRGSLLAVLPLSLERKFGIKALVCPGGKHLSKLPLLTQNRNPDLLPALVTYLSGKGNFYLSEADEVLALSISRNCGKIMQRKASENPYFSLAGGPFPFFSNRHQHSLRKKVKKMEKHLTYRCHKGDPESLKPVFAIDFNSAKRARGMPTFVTEKDRSFYRQLVENFGEQVTVCLLYYDSRPMVFEIGFIYKNIYHSSNTAYDAVFSRFSPRKLLLFYTLARLYREGFSMFDFSRGINSLKTAFTPLSNSQYDLYFSQKAWIRAWWAVAAGIRDKLIGNKMLYQAYCFLKKIFIERRGQYG